MQFIRRNQKAKEVERDDDYYFASQWQLVWHKYKRHKLALFGMVIILLLYFVANFADFFAIHDYQERHVKYVYAPPQTLHFVDDEGNFHLIPFLSTIDSTMDCAGSSITTRVVINAGLFRDHNCSGDCWLDDSCARCARQTTGIARGRFCDGSAYI